MALTCKSAGVIRERIVCAQLLALQDCGSLLEAALRANSLPRAAPVSMSVAVTSPVVSTKMWQSVVLSAISLFESREWWNSSFSRKNRSTWRRWDNFLTDVFVYMDLQSSPLPGRASILILKDATSDPTSHPDYSHDRDPTLDAVQRSFISRDDPGSPGAEID